MKYKFFKNKSISKHSFRRIEQKEKTKIKKAQQNIQRTNKSLRKIKIQAFINQNHTN